MLADNNPKLLARLLDEAEAGIGNCSEINKAPSQLKADSTERKCHSVQMCTPLALAGSVAYCSLAINTGHCSRGFSQSWKSAHAPALASNAHVCTPLLLTFMQGVPCNHQMYKLEAMHHSANRPSGAPSHQCICGCLHAAGEYGRPLQQVPCPKCQRNIGGEQHRLEAGNQHAGSYSARGPAKPQGQLRSQVLHTVSTQHA